MPAWAKNRLLISPPTVLLLENGPISMKHGLLTLKMARQKLDYVHIVQRMSYVFVGNLSIELRMSYVFVGNLSITLRMG